MPAEPNTAVSNAAVPARGLDALVKEAEFDGNLRSFLMVTSNRGELQDWSSFGLGANLGLRTGRLAGFGLGLRLYSATEVVGNSLELDPVTGRPSRYELGLYDLAEASGDAALLGEAYVDFEAKGHHAWLGRHLLKSPLINPQDGRLIPTLVQGAWYRNTSLPKLTLQLGYLSHVAPRGSSLFSSVADSIGVFPSGKAVDGQAADYAGNLSSAGVFVGSLGYRDPLLEVQVWDYLVENIFNTAYLETAWTPKVGSIAYRLGLQAIAQQRLADGGAVAPSQRYFEQPSSFVVGATLGATTDDGWLARLSGNWISDSGRFLFPREWGKEPLFVFQKRERSEGSGDQWTILAEVGKTWSLAGGSKLSTQLGYGHSLRPAASESELNKYALPALAQINLDTSYAFGSDLTGLSLELLIVYKTSLESGLGNPALVLNKVEMMNWNFVVNYAF